MCRECSTRILYEWFGKQRVCNNCQREMGREDRVLLRIYHKAGYGLMTLAAVRKELESGRQEYRYTLRDEVLHVCQRLAIIAKQAKEGEDAALRDHVLGCAKELRQLCGKRR